MKTAKAYFFAFCLVGFFALGIIGFFAVAFCFFSGSNILTDWWLSGIVCALAIVLGFISCINLVNRRML